MKEKLDPNWSKWFDDFDVEVKENITLLEGFIVDQAALYGLLNKIRDLGLTLLSLQEAPENEVNTRNKND